MLWCQTVRSDAPRVDRVAALIARGQQRASVGDYLSAIGYFRDAIGQAPRDQRGYRALGAAYLETEQASRAVEVYEAALYACGEEPELLLALAEAQERCDRSEVALLILRRLAERSHALSRVHQLRAEIAERVGRFSEALDARRALLAEHLRSGAAESPRELALQVKALGLLVGEADRLNDRDACAAQATPIRRALGDCR
jgi:tetratricopeptide (TPR) repeat protein